MPELHAGKCSKDTTTMIFGLAAVVRLYSWSGVVSAFSDYTSHWTILTKKVTEYLLVGYLTR